MTRINVGIKPKELNKQLAFAEYREIKRIPNAIISGKANINSIIPSEFILGQGHVKFFYNKLGFLYKRYKALQQRCIDLHISIANYDDSFDIAWLMYPQLFGNYEPSSRDRELVLERFNQLNHKLECIT